MVSTCYQHIWKLASGNSDGNPYENLSAALPHLGINTKTEKGYESKIGLALNKRTPVPIAKVKSLVAESLPVTDTRNSSLEGLIRETLNDLNINEEEYTMWIDIPVDNPNHIPVIYMASAATSLPSKSAVSARLPDTAAEPAPNKSVSPTDSNPTGPSQSATLNYKLGVCAAFSDVLGSHSAYLSGDAAAYLELFVPEAPAGAFNDDLDKVKINIVQKPKHGQFKLADEIKGQSKFEYVYLPSKGFKGTDKIIVDVTNGTYVVQIQYTFVVTTEDNLENYDMDGNKSINTALCNGKDVWRISSVPENTTAEQQVAFENVYINNLINNANTAFGGFSDLTGIILACSLGNNAQHSQ